MRSENVVIKVDLFSMVDLVSKGSRPGRLDLGLEAGSRPRREAGSRPGRRAKVQIRCS